MTVAPASRAWPMKRLRLRRDLLLVACAVAGLGAARPVMDLHAQSVTTAAIRGTVRMTDGGDPDGGRVSVRSAVSGFVVETEVRRGRFLVQGLEAGGPYTVTIRRIGATAWQLEGIALSPGQTLDLDVLLDRATVQLDSLVVTSAALPSAALGHGGTAATLTDSLVHRLPTLNRDVYDFLRLVPQVSTRIGFPAGGVSGGGVGFRLNHFLTNGVPERSLSGGQPPEFAGGRSLPFEAVREYQVLLAPFDARYGDFAGVMVNTVTRSGTNRVAGSLLVQGRSDDLSRRGALAAPRYERWQYGASLSGPIVRDRAHFFAAAEYQSLNAPMTGPYVGQPDDAASPIPVGASDLSGLSTALRLFGMTAGSGGPLSSRTEVGSLFLRLDAALAVANSRAVLWFNGSDVRNLAFSRAASPDTFLLTSHAAEARFRTRTLALQLYSALRHPAGASNELSVSSRSIPFQSVPQVRQPIARVVVPATTGGMTTLVAGAPPQAQGRATRTWSVNLRDDLTLALGASHVLSLGAETEWFRIGPGGVANALGTWTFLSLDSLRAGLADRYEIARDFGSASVPISGNQLAACAGDRWRTGRLTLTLGLRADRLAVNQRAPYSRMVDSLFNRRTDAAFRSRLHLSPRFGFTWDLSRSGREQLRGGVGIFTGRPPLAWLHVPLQDFGEGIGTLRCGTLPGDLGLPPPFNPDPDRPPLTCAAGEGLNAPPRGDVDVIDPNLRMAQTLRAALAYARQLPGNLVGTVEALLTWNVSDFAFVNLNLVGPVSVDRRGRVLYGSLDSLGRARPARVTDSLPSVVELRRVSRNHSVTLAASLERQFADGFSAMASYAWSRVRDVQTPLRVNTRGFVNWASGAVSGDHSDMTPGISLNDVPHRVVFAGTWRAPWRRWETEVSLLYVGESGSPFTYRAGGAGGRGDLNADGALNDPIYVPRDAFDPAQIVFSGVSAEPGADNSPAAQNARIQAQRTAFEQFIRRTPCLRERRGRIVQRNGCREPWTHTTVASLRQAIPVGPGGLEAQLDVYNLLNLLDRDWGHRRFVASPALLEHVGQTTGPTGQPEPVFRFVSASATWTSDPSESAFQLQFGVRYRF
jgi:hypothetical protein